MSKRIRIVLADDHPMFLEGLNSLLCSSEDIEVAGLALHGNDVLDILARKEIDIVVTDISMPGMDGITLHSTIKQKYTQVKTLVLTTYGEPEKIIKLINNKADGYLLKNAEKNISKEEFNYFIISYDASYVFCSWLFGLRLFL